MAQGFYTEEDRGHDTPCYIWQGPTDRAGYGIVYSSGVSYPAHRLSFTAEYAPVPQGHVLHHVCRQKACCNPAHLIAMTPRDHSRIETLEKVGLMDLMERGTCYCGCGWPTEVAKKTDIKRGNVEGYPRRYKNGHHPNISKGTRMRLEGSAGA